MTQELAAAPSNERDSSRPGRYGDHLTEGR
jgi:hypothetical protein